LLRAWPESTQQRLGFKKCVKSAISATSALFIFRRFFVFPYRFLIFFLFVPIDGRPEDYYGFGDRGRGVGRFVEN
jgi:hypothetical protein